jgi:hypothetical protein
VLIAVGGLVWHHRKEEAPIPVASQCTVPGSDVVLTTEQGANAATIAAVARSRGLPARATVIALATAQQESRLRNLDYGDRDSLGLFQQRPSQGWGTPGQVQDPVYAAGKFYDHLVKVPGWDTGRLTEVAQAVQRSGFPEAYQQWEPLASALTGALLATSPTPLSCTFTPGAEPGPLGDRATAVAAAVRREAGTPTVAPDGELGGRARRAVPARPGGDGRLALDARAWLGVRPELLRNPAAAAAARLSGGQPARRCTAVSMRSSVAVSAMRTCWLPAGP